MNILISYDQPVSSLPAGFAAAVSAVTDFYKSQFTDNITFNLHVGYGEVHGTPLGGGALGSSFYFLNPYSYSQLKSALSGDATSNDDVTALRNVPAVDPIGGAHQYWLADVQAKALGLIPQATVVDAYVGFSNNFAFDYDRSNGITAGQYDFYGTAAHEIAEVMGKNIMVGERIGSTTGYTISDLFHYSSPGVRDLSGTTPGYFSIDGGATNLNNFNTDPGGDFGDWASTAGSDSWLAFANSGVINAVSETDLRFLDVIGFDRAGAGQPDLAPSNMVLQGTTARFQINNIGTGSAAATTTGIYLSPDSAIDSADALLASISTPALAAGASDSESISLNFSPAAVAGLYFVGVIANYNGQLSESNTGNNASNAAPILLGTNGADTLTGTAGNDTVIGFGGNDTLVGGSGDDTAVFSANLSAYSVQDLGNRVVVSGPDGNDTVFSSEHLQFADGTINYNDGDPLFDTIFYDRNNLDVFHAGVDAEGHYNTSGWHEGRDPDPLFSTIGYLGANPDVKAAGVNPLQHYDRSGWKEGRDPSAGFDTTLYLLHNPDVKAAGIDPLAHYLQFGISEGRQAYAAIGNNIVGGFDAEYYLLSNPDVAAAGIDPLQHFNMFGWKEGRNPNAYFDTKGYLAHYTDVAAAGVNPLQHYDQVGWTEGRDPSVNFDTKMYLSHYNDVAAAHIDPLMHYLQFGAYENRSTFADGVFA